MGDNLKARGGGGSVPAVDRPLTLDLCGDVSCRYNTVTDATLLFPAVTDERGVAERGVGASGMKPLIIGIAGGTGSGKSTVARRVAEALRAASVAFIDMDAYYKNFAHLPLDERRRINWDHPDAFDFDLFVDQLTCLSRGRPIEKPEYDFVQHVRAARTTRIEPADVVVIDGILLFVEPSVRDLCDVKVFVDADPDTRLVRRIRRDVQKRGRSLDEILEQYLSTVQPMHLQFVEPSKRYADVIVPRGGHNEVAVEMIVAKIQRRLGGGPA
jgi:uridine kinase